MNTSLSTKFAALALALSANAVMLSATAYLMKAHPLSLPQTAAQTGVGSASVA